MKRSKEERHAKHVLKLSPYLSVTVVVVYGVCNSDKYLVLVAISVELSMCLSLAGIECSLASWPYVLFCQVVV